MFAWEIRVRLLKDAVCTDDSLPSVSSINRSQLTNKLVQFSGLTEGGRGGSCRRAQQVRGRKHPGQKNFTTNDHKIEFDNVF